MAAKVNTAEAQSMTSTGDRIMADRKADKAPVGSGMADKAAKTLRERRKRQKSRLDEIMASMTTRDNKGK